MKRFEEYLELIVRLWTEDSVTYHSETCQLDNVRMNLRPVQKPPPPIWIAANNDRAIERAARMSDAWMINPHSTLERQYGGIWLSMRLRWPQAADHVQRSCR